MIKTTEMLLKELSSYQKPYDKIKRLVNEKKLFLLKKGLYETDGNLDGYLLANKLYGPSYLSFDFALSYYGLIPERVYTYTSATCQKKKTKKYTNHFGNYTYQDVPTDVFPIGVEIKTEKDYSFLIATREKALCDKLYIRKPVNNQTELSQLLFEDLRIDEIEFDTLNLEDIKSLSSEYHSNNVTLLYKYIMRRHRTES